jgi:hypothetical protein
MEFFRTMIKSAINLHWFYDPLPDWALLNVDEYRRVMPDYQVTLIREIPCDFPEKYKPAMDAAPTGRLKSDLLRYWLMYRDGGFYVDIDTRPVRSFDDLRSLQAFLPLVKMSPSGSGYLDMCFIGSEAGHPFWMSALEGALAPRTGFAVPDAWYWIKNLVPQPANYPGLTIIEDPVDMPPWRVTGKHMRCERESLDGLRNSVYVRHYAHVSQGHMFAPVIGHV